MLELKNNDKKVFYRNPDADTFNAIRIEKETFENCSITEEFSFVSFRNVSFEDVVFFGCTFDDCEFTDCIFDTVTFIGCNFDSSEITGSRITNVYINECRFTGTLLNRISFADICTVSDTFFKNVSVECKSRENVSLTIESCMFDTCTLPSSIQEANSIVSSDFANCGGTDFDINTLNIRGLFEFPIVYSKKTKYVWYGNYRYDFDEYLTTATPEQREFLGFLFFN